MRAAWCLWLARTLLAHPDTPPKSYDRPSPEPLNCEKVLAGWVRASQILRQQKEEPSSPLTPSLQLTEASSSVQVSRSDSQNAPVVTRGETIE